MARTTVPFEALGVEAAVACAGNGAADALPAAAWLPSAGLEAGAVAPDLAACDPPRPRPPLPRRRLRRGSPFPSRRGCAGSVSGASECESAGAGASNSASADLVWTASGSAMCGSELFGHFGFGGSSRRRRRISVVIGGLQWGLCGRSLAGFRILFGALATIAHPLAHLWFVTQLHITGNLRRLKRTKAASIFVRTHRSLTISPC